MRLRTTSAQFRRAHELPGWYASLAELTPQSMWTVGTGRAEFDVARARLDAGPAVLRDYTKSMKHYWDEAAFIPDLADADRAWRVASRFAELREVTWSAGSCCAASSGSPGRRCAPGGSMASAG